VAAGLATGFKYPGVFLVVPLVVCAWGRWRRLAVAIACMVLAFLASSPFVLVHGRQAWHEAFRVQRLARRGWLGFENDHSAPIAFSAHLWHAFGPVILISVVGLAVAIWRRTRTDLVLVSFVVVYFADLMTLRAHFDRYALPLVPPLATLAGRFRALAPVTLLLLVVPLTWTIRADKRVTRTDTRVVAARWIQQHIPHTAPIAEDPSTPAVVGYRILPLQLPGPGRAFDPNRNLARLKQQGIRDVVISGAVTDRVLAARSRYPGETAFYTSLSRTARRIYYVAPGSGRAGPWVAIYAL
jgi:hypothetical protein